MSVKVKVKVKVQMEKFKNIGVLPLIVRWLEILLGTSRYWTILTNIVQYYWRMPNIVQYCLILSNITKYCPIVIYIAHNCPVLFNIVQVTISAHSYQKYDIARNIQILCKIVIYPNIVRHKNWSLALIWSQSSHFVTF